MDGRGKGECFVGGNVGGEDGLFLILGSCWFEEVFAFGVVTLMRLAPFVGASKTRGTSCGRRMSDIVLTAWSAQRASMLGKGELELWTDQLY